MLCGLEKVIVTVGDPLVVVNALVSVVVDLIGCMSYYTPPEKAYKILFVPMIAYFLAKLFTK